MDGIIASRNYYPGDLIYHEPPFAQVLPGKLKDLLCESCGKPSIFLRACKQCLAVKYCGKVCQKNDWSSHRLECKHLKELPKGDCADFVRLLGKVILKIKDKDWKVIKRRVFGKDLSFDDIDSHCKDLMENPRLNLFFKEIKELTGNYIGFENMPADEDLMKIVGKVKFNTFTTRSLCFYIGFAVFGMECIPTTNAGFSGDGMKVWAIRKIRKGEDKITLPSRAILSPKLRFMEELNSPCKCTDCSLPYGESVLSHIVDETRAFSIINETEVVLRVAAIIPSLDLHEMTEVVDKLLEKQEGVLGNTNYLRLRLLALKCLEIGGHPLLMKRPLMDLEKSMRSVFGEYYSEMQIIYEALGIINLKLGNLVEGALYLEKVNRLLRP